MNSMQNPAKQYSNIPSIQQQQHQQPVRDVFEGIGHRDRTGDITPRHHAGTGGVSSMHGGPLSSEKLQKDRNRANEYRLELEQQIREKKKREVDSRDRRRRDISGGDDRLPWQREQQPVQQQLGEGWEMGPMGLPVRKSSPVKKSMHQPAVQQHQQQQQQQQQSQQQQQKQQQIPQFPPQFLPQFPESPSRGGANVHAQQQNLYSDPNEAQEDRDEKRKNLEMQYRKDIEAQIEATRQEKLKKKEQEAELERIEMEKMKADQEEMKQRYEDEEKAKAEKEAAELKAQLDKDATEHRRLKEAENNKLKEQDRKAEEKARRQIEEMNREVEMQKNGPASSNNNNNNNSNIVSSMDQSVGSVNPEGGKVEFGHMQRMGSEQGFKNSDLFDPSSDPKTMTAKMNKFQQAAQDGGRSPQKFSFDHLREENNEPPPVQRLNPREQRLLERQQKHNTAKQQPSPSQHQQQHETIYEPPVGMLGGDSSSNASSITNLRSGLGKKLQEQIQQIQDAQSKQMALQQKLLEAQLKLPMSTSPNASMESASMMRMETVRGASGFETARSMGPELGQESKMVMDWDVRLPFAVTPQGKVVLLGKEDLAKVSRPPSRAENENEEEEESEETMNFEHTKIEDGGGLLNFLNDNAADQSEIEVQDSRDLSQPIVVEERYDSSVELEDSVVGSVVEESVVEESLVEESVVEESLVDESLLDESHSSLLDESDSSESSSMNFDNENLQRISTSNEQIFTIKMLDKKKKLHKPQPRPKNRRYDVGRMDGLDVVGYDNDNNDETKSSAISNRPSSSVARLTSPHPTATKPYTPVEAAPTKHFRKYQVGNIKKLDIEGLIDDDNRSSYTPSSSRPLSASNPTTKSTSEPKQQKQEQKQRQKQQQQQQQNEFERKVESDNSVKLIMEKRKHEIEMKRQEAVMDARVKQMKAMHAASKLAHKIASESAVRARLQVAEARNEQLVLSLKQKMNERHRIIVSRFVKRMLHTHLLSTFAAWSEFSIESKRHRMIVQRFVRRWKSMQKVSERSERALMKTQSMNPAEWLQTATYTTKLTHSIRLAHLVRSPSLKCASLRSAQHKTFSAWQQFVVSNKEARTRDEERQQYEEKMRKEHEVSLLTARSDHEANLLIARREMELDAKRKEVVMESRIKQLSAVHAASKLAHKIASEVSVRARLKVQQVSERSERALVKTRAMNPAKWPQTATSTTKLTHSILLTRSFFSCFIKNAPRFARHRMGITST